MTDFDERQTAPQEPASDNPSFRAGTAQTTGWLTKRVAVSFTATILMLVGCVGCGGGGGGGGGAPPGSSSGAVPPPASGTLDNRVGLGSDSNGIPILTKDANARYIYWNPTLNSANDSNAGTDPNAPKRTLKSAWEALRNGYGDWLLMAQGATNTNGFGGYLASRSGKSAQYPIVVTTYDPAAADPTNVSAMRQGSATIGTSASDRSQGIYLLNFTGQNIVFENIDSPAGIWLTRESNSPHSFNILFHNVRVIGSQSTLENSDYDPSVTDSVRDVIFRHCVFAYSPGQGMYLWGTRGVTIEDSIFYHNGWVNSRSEANDRDHNAYFGEATWDTIFRRNMSGQASSHGLQLRGGGLAQDNVFGTNPINMAIGDGDAYATFRPAGVLATVTGNVIQGSTNINSSAQRGWGISNDNLAQGSLIQNNIIANRGSFTSSSIYSISFHDSPPQDIDTYPNFDNNIVYNWPGGESLGAAMSQRRFPTRLHLTYTNNVNPYDDVYAPANGNLNTPASSYPDPTRTIASWATLNGYASEGVLWEGMMANPKAGWAKSIGDYIKAGFGR